MDDKLSDTRQGNRALPLPLQRGFPIHHDREHFCKRIDLCDSSIRRMYSIQSKHDSRSLDTRITFAHLNSFPLGSRMRRFRGSCMRRRLHFVANYVPLQFIFLTARNALFTTRMASSNSLFIPLAYMSG